MIQSMTGYGNAVVAYKDKKIHVTPCLAPCDAWHRVMQIKIKINAKKPYF